MESQIIHTRPMQAYRNIRPAHARKLSSVELILIRMCHVTEVHYSSIVVILARKDRGVEIVRVDVSNWMLIGVPSSKAKIESAHESDIAIYQTKLFVMRPV